MQETLTYNQILELFKETDRKFQETKELLAKSSLETDRKFQETDNKIRDLSKKIVFANNIQVPFSESLFINSICRILSEKFKCSDFSLYRRFYLNDDSFEIDIFGLSKSSIYVIEIVDFKSKLKLSAIKQIHDHITKVRKIKTEYKDRKIFGIIAAVDYEQRNADQVMSKGYYFVSILDNLAVLHISESFKPKFW
jgi:hypothetical protein